MKEWWSGKIIYVGIIIFAVVVIATLVFLIKFGGVYKGGLANLTNKNPDQEVILKKKKEVKRLSIRKKGETSCIVITPDGVVRQYEICGGDLTDAQRLSDSKHITQLFKRVSESDFAKLQGLGEEVYEVTIYTDTGTEVIYISSNGGGQEAQIIKEIVLISGDVHDPTPIPLQSGAIETPESSIQPTSPLASGILTPTPSASPQTDTLIPFICDYIETGSKKKPYNVSNVICSEAPLSP